MRPQTAPRNTANRIISGASHPKSPVSGESESEYAPGELRAIRRKRGAPSTLRRNENTPEGSLSRASLVSETQTAPASEPVSAVRSPKRELGELVLGVHIATTAPMRPSKTPRSSCLCTPDPASIRYRTSIIPCALLNRNALDTLVNRSATSIDALHHICAQLATATCHRSRLSLRSAVVHNTVFEYSELLVCLSVSCITIGTTASVHV
mmetsp:Transcript_8315/g.17886  ORF Transcript_8315/g.17886 Transcript_8315/m.17886 type:complete len:209 (+) Transcript_8315:189-815(+)